MQYASVHRTVSSLTGIVPFRAALAKCCRCRAGNPVLGMSDNLNECGRLACRDSAHQVPFKGLACCHSLQRKMLVESLQQGQATDWCLRVSKALVPALSAPAQQAVRAIKVLHSLI